MTVSLIAAIAAHRVIGNRGALPWRLPDDMARFKRLTMGNPVVMGRGTWQSMGRALPGRHNVVLSRDPSLVIGGCTVVHSMEEAVSAVGPVRELFVIGGAQVYALFLPSADRLYITWIDAEVPGDAFFPEVPWEEWRIVAEETAKPGSAFPHRFTDYERRAPR